MTWIALIVLAQVPDLDAADLEVRARAEGELWAALRDGTLKREDLVARARNVGPEARCRVDALLARHARLAALEDRLAPLDRIGLPSVREARFVTAWGSSGWLLAETREEMTFLDVQECQVRALVPKYEDSSFEEAVDREARSGEEPDERALLFAYWSMQRGDDLRAATLVARLERAAPFTNDKLEFPAFVSCVAGRVMYRRLPSIVASAPRREVLDAWRRLSELPRHNRTDEAVRNVLAYASLLREDARHVARDEAAVAAMTVAERARYWTWRLRDCVSHDPYGADFAWEDDATPASQLERIGWEALPALVEAFDDTRPSRCVGADPRWGHWWVSPQGTCAKRIAARITGRDFTSVEAGRVWWRLHGAAGPIAWFEEAVTLAGRPREQEFAAEKLLAADRARYLQRLLDISVAQQGALIDVLRPHLTAAHRPYLEAVVEKGNDCACADAAAIVWRLTGSEKGVAELAKRLAIGGRPGHFVHEGPDALAAIRTAGSRRAMIGLLEHPNELLRGTVLDMLLRECANDILDALP